MTMLPNLFLPGAARSGTTTLYYWPSSRSEAGHYAPHNRRLGDLPGIDLAHRKDPHRAGTIPALEESPPQ